MHGSASLAGIVTDELESIGIFRIAHFPVGLRPAAGVPGDQRQAAGDAHGRQHASRGPQLRALAEAGLEQRVGLGRRQGQNELGAPDQLPSLLEQDESLPVPCNAVDPSLVPDLQPRGERLGERGDSCGERQPTLAGAVRARLARAPLAPHDSRPALDALGGSDRVESVEESRVAAVVERHAVVDGLLPLDPACGAAAPDTPTLLQHQRRRFHAASQQLAGTRQSGDPRANDDDAVDVGLRFPRLLIIARNPGSDPAHGAVPSWREDRGDRGGRLPEGRGTRASATRGFPSSPVAVAGSRVGSFVCRSATVPAPRWTCRTNGDRPPTMDRS
jgi:hypothetical protein